MRTGIFTCYVLFTIVFLPIAYADSHDPPKNDYDIMPIIISAILASGVFGGFVINVRASRGQTKANYLKIVNDYQDKFENLKRGESNLNTKIDCELYVLNYLDILDAMVYAQSKNWIPLSVLDYFKDGDFKYGMTLFTWYGKQGINVLSPEQIWPHFSQWCYDNQITQFDPKASLPSIFHNFHQLPSQDQQNYQLIRTAHENQIRLMVSDKDLLQCYNHGDIPKKYSGKVLHLHELTLDERKLFNFFVLELDLYERVFMAKRAGSISDEEWYLWIEWFKIFKNNWLFEFAFKRMAHVFEPKLMITIGEKIFNISRNDMESLITKNKQEYA